MPDFLKLAEKIFNEVKRNTGFTNDPVEDLNNLMLVLRVEIKKTNRKLLYNYFDFEAMMMCSEESLIKLDISIIPKSKNEDEYILWLASFIEKITYKYKDDEVSTNSRVVKPNYFYDDSGNIVSGKICSGDEILMYFKEKKDMVDWF